MAEKKKKKKPGWLKRRPYVPYIMPTMAVMTMLFVIPVLFIFVISLTNYRLGYGIEDISFLGLGNYIRLFDGSENAFYYSIFISLVLTVLGTALQLVIGMGCAMLLNCEFKGKAVAVACMIVPIAMTPSIASQIWKLMFNNEFGIINHILNQLFHINISWLDEKHAFLSVVIATIWQYVPFVTLMLYAGLRSLPEEIYESAALDGANRIQIFFNVTLPMMKRLILLCTLLRMIDMLKTFDIPYVLTQGGPGSATKFLGLLIYDTGFGETNFVARSAAMAVILIFITSTLSLILFRIQRKNAKE
ncbi:MAG: sugar ABC transporter permease [Ruminococcus sp.]|nr:sugar ABC transporter permease [Ruminococcus sp.]